MASMKSMTVKEALMVLQQAFNDHVDSEERRLKTIETNVSVMPGMSNTLTRIETLMGAERDDLVQLNGKMQSFDLRLRAVEHWRWGMAGAIPVLTLLGLYVLRHVFNIIV